MKTHVRVTFFITETFLPDVRTQAIAEDLNIAIEHDRF